MKLYVLVLIFSVSLSASADQWIQRTDFIGKRSRGVAFAINQKGYVGTGYLSVGHIYKDLWCYDPSNDSWTQVADLPGSERTEAFGFAAVGKGYVGGGYVGVGTGKDFYEYDPVVNIWYQKADLPEARRFAVAFAIGSKGYFGTGINVSIVRKDFWEYDPSLDTWTRKADIMGDARQMAIGFSINGKGYIGTGIDSAGYLRKDFYEYDATTDSWTSKADFGGGPVAGASSFVIGMKCYAGMGLTQTFLTKELWQYNPLTDSWMQRLNFRGSDCWSAMNFSINNKGYVCGGDTLVNMISSDQSDANWEYSPDSLDAIDELSFEEAGIEIFPNPVHNFINVHSKYPIVLSAYSEGGKEIFINRKCENILKIDVHNWAAGIYFLKAEVNKQSLVHRLVKE